MRISTLVLCLSTFALVGPAVGSTGGPGVRQRLDSPWRHGPAPDGLRSPYSYTSTWTSSRSMRIRFASQGLTAA